MTAVARTERVTIGLTREEFNHLNAMRIEADRELTISQFARSLLLEIIADDHAAHEEVE